MNDEYAKEQKMKKERQGFGCMVHELVIADCIVTVAALNIIEYIDGIFINLLNYYR